ncbi:MAG: RDD family protein [Pedobacter sp.]
MDTIKVNTSQNVAIDYPVAGLGERIAARLIDLLFFLILYILFILMGLISAAIKGEVVILVLMIAYFAGYIFYNLIFEIFFNGQSIGKRFLKIKVISLDGSQPTLGQYFIRWLFRLIDFVFTLQTGGLISIAVTENKQRIGDVVAGTTVIKMVPRTTMEHIAFHPHEVDPNYIPMFPTVQQLTDRDVELIYEVIGTFYKTGNRELILTMGPKTAQLIGVSKPQDMNELEFLNAVVKDYNHLTSFKA